MPKRSVGVVKGRSADTSPSLRDQIVDREEVEVQIESEIKTPEKPPKLPKKGRKKKNQRENINYFGALDDILADVYEKQAGAYKIMKAVTQLMESRGHDVPFEEDQFERICGNLALIQAGREIAYLYGLGPVHADKVAEYMLERYFRPPSGKK